MPTRLAALRMLARKSTIWRHSFRLPIRRTRTLCLGLSIRPMSARSILRSSYGSGEGSYVADNSTSPTEVFGGAFWSGEKLLANQSVVRGFDPAQVDVNAYNLRMGSVYFKTADESGAHQGKVTLSPKQCFIIPPGQFAYLLTKEAIEVPNDAMAFISMRTRIKYQGLINVSGFHVDPGYKGHLIYAVYNASPSPVQLCENDPAFKIWFCSLDRTSQKPYLYGGKEISDIDNDLVRGMSREVLSLQSLSDKFRSLEIEINREVCRAKAYYRRTRHHMEKHQFRHHRRFGVCLSLVRCSGRVGAW